MNIIKYLYVKYKAKQLYKHYKKTIHLEHVTLLNKVRLAMTLTDYTYNPKLSISDCRNYYLNPPMCSLHSMLIELEDILNSCETDSIIKTNVFNICNKQIRLDIWVNSVNTAIFEKRFEHYDLYQAYVKATDAMKIIIQTAETRKWSDDYLIRKCSKVLSMYVLLTEVIMELNYE